MPVENEAGPIPACKSPSPAPSLAPQNCLVDSGLGTEFELRESVETKIEEPITQPRVRLGKQISE